MGFEDGEWVCGVAFDDCNVGFLGEALGGGAGGIAGQGQDFEWGGGGEEGGDDGAALFASPACDEEFSERSCHFGGDKSSLKCLMVGLYN